MRFSYSQAETHYEQIGKGFPLVLLHGWGCDWQIWSPVISQLSEHFQLIIPDLPAFGRSTLHQQIWTTKEYVAWLEAFVKKVVGDKKFFLLGHSFGGKIAALYTADTRNKPQHLILVDSAGIPLPLSKQQQFTQRAIALVPAMLKNKMPITLKKNVLQKMGVATDHLLSTEQQRKILQATVRQDIRPQLARIDTATTIIWGELDQETPIEDGKQFYRIITGSTLHIFPDSDHFPFIHNPKHFCQIIEKLL